MDSFAIVIRGGLGNQLFQLAAAAYLEANGIPTQVEISQIRHAYFADRIDWEYVAQNWKVTNGPHHCSAPVTEAPELAAVLNAASRGACCAPNYFQYQELLQADSTLHSVGRLIEWQLRRRPDVPEVNTAVHVRIGDYSRPAVAARLGCLTSEYYFDALGLLSPKNIVAVLDDPAGFRRLHPRLASKSALSVTTDGSEWTDFETLARARNVVVANSTFSLWPAWFASKVWMANQTVIYPDPWTKIGNRGFALGELGWFGVHADFFEEEHLARALPFRGLRRARLRRLTRFGRGFGRGS